MIKKCEVCKKDYKTKPSHKKRRKYCSYHCFDVARRETLKGDKNPCWRGGKPKCSDCSKELPFYDRKRCIGCSRKFMRGKNHYNWQGGKTSKNMKLRNSLEMKKWRYKVFIRDNFTCQGCGQYGGKLHVDHIKPFSLFPKLRLSLKNGRVLCIPCHKKTDTYLSKIKKYAEAH